MNFLKSKSLLLVLAAILLIATVWTNRTKNRPQPTNTINNMVDQQIFLAKNEKIDYRAQKALTPELAALIVDTFACETEILTKIGTADMALSSNAHQIQMNWSYVDIVAIRQRYWQSLQQHHRRLYQKLKLGPYSDEAYGFLLTTTLPKLFAPYGVFAKPIYIPVYEIQADRIDLAEPILMFYRIEAVKSSVIEQWGKRFRRDVVYISGPLLVNGKAMTPPQFTPSPGQSFYQNVIIYRPELSKELGTGGMTENKLREMVQEVAQRPEEHYWDTVQQASDQYQAALGAAILKAVVKAESPSATLADVEQTIIAHETRHLIDQMDPLYRRSFGGALASTASQDIRRLHNLSVHEEINGLLGQIRYGNRKIDSLGAALMSARPGITQDFAHDKAGRWVLEHATAAIATAPERYGLRIDASRSIQPQNQILMQLPLLSDESWNRLAEVLYSEHRSGYNEDFGDEVMAELFKPQ